MKKQKNKLLILIIAVLSVSNLFFLFLLSKEKSRDDKIEVKTEKVLEISQAESEEPILEADAGRKMDRIDGMNAEELEDYLKEYAYYYYDKSINIRNIIEKELNYYFPKNRGWYWTVKVVNKEENDYILQFQDYGYLLGGDIGYEAQIRIRPDFTVELVEDSIKIKQEKKGICIYKADKEYIYHGSKIVEYYGEYYNKEQDVYLETILPLFSIRENNEWKRINSCIWEGVEKWLDEELDYQGGKVSLDYEITTLDENLYSIHFSGQYEKDNEKEDVEFGITISINNETLLSKSVFTTVKEDCSFFDYYIEDNTLLLLTKEKDFYESIRDREVDFLSYVIVREDRNVVAVNGRIIGECYYELPEMLTHVSGADWIGMQMRNDMGRFFNELVNKYEEVLLFLDEGVVYGSWEDLETQTGYIGHRCYVESEIIYNNGGVFGVKYHYWVNLVQMICVGEAVAVYDTNREIIEYEDWQGEIVEKIRSTTFENWRGEKL